MHLSGDKGQNGAISNMYYKYGKNEMELTETITKNDLPHTFEAHYHHKHIDNSMKCNFTTLSDDETRYAYEYEYKRINWVIPKPMSILFPSMDKKLAEKWLRQFKALSENYKSDT
ncbi:SRPBCC family protein [uncultured Winogradskyella sp.]|uniref:SRPBCC family protein n=1 Tax=uncultured Winogradskyella sp. TaxID=395353 RepID=UPI002628CEEC|nr:SRPBCC family protein [uncultured Winogradskyella sp.]